MGKKLGKNNRHREMTVEVFGSIYSGCSCNCDTFCGCGIMPPYLESSVHNSNQQRNYAIIRNALK